MILTAKCLDYAVKIYRLILSENMTVMRFYSAPIILNGKRSNVRILHDTEKRQLQNYWCLGRS